MPAPSTLDVTAVVERAAADAEVEPDPDASWYPALELLVASAAAEGGLSTQGGEVFAGRLRKLVGERLRADRLLDEEPQIRARPLPVRFVVAGLARSGTTFLHRLLSCDPDVEFLPTWQAFNAVPPRVGVDDRRSITVEMVERLRRDDPGAFRIHPLDADAPEEEVFLLQHSFASMLFALAAPLPTYNAWLNTTDHTGAYEFAFDLIRLNEWASATPSGRPRVMKSPQFVLDLDAVSRLLPETVIVQTHRDLVDLVGSYCSTYESSRAKSCATVDRRQLGEERVGQLQAMAVRSLSVRRAAEGDGTANRFVDVHYDELVGDPVGVVESLYEAAGIALGGPARRAIEGWLEQNPQNKSGRHTYDLATYGLDASAVEARFAHYLDYFGREDGS